MFFPIRRGCSVPMFMAMQPLAAAAAMTGSVQEAAMTPFVASQVSVSFRRIISSNRSIARL